MTYRFPLAAGFSDRVTDKRLRISDATTKDDVEEEPKVVGIGLKGRDRAEKERRRFADDAVSVIVEDDG